MAVTLGGIPLFDDLVLQGLESAPLAVATVTTCIGGKAWVQSDGTDAVAGIALSLVGVNNFTLGQVIALQTLRGQTVELVHHRGTYQVVVLTTPDEPTFNHANPDATAWYSGQITMITV